MAERVHGGTDAGPPVRFDFSTNANALGPNPFVTEALAGVDVGPYPDPSYAAVSAKLAAFHEIDSDRIVVGGGASELIWRSVAATTGPVALRSSTFGEYAAAAEALGRPVVTTNDEAGLLDAIAGAGLAFVCVPNNPDGLLPTPGFLDEAQDAAASNGGVLVIDAAYAPLCDEPVDFPEGAVVLHAPNKAHGCTGIRAGYATAPQAVARRLRRIAPSWVVGSHGVAFLDASVNPESQAWLEDTVPTLWAWRRDLTDGLRDRGFDVTPSPANYVIVDVGDATPVTERLRTAGIRVRDCTSFGLPRHLRLSARAPDATSALLRELERIRSSNGTAEGAG